MTMTRADLVGEGADGRDECSGQAEVGDLEAAVPRHQDVLRLQVAAGRTAMVRLKLITYNTAERGICSPVHDSSHVAVVQTAQQLACVRLDYKVNITVLLFPYEIINIDDSLLTRTSWGDNGPSHASKYFFKSLSTNSKTRYSLPSFCTTSFNLQKSLRDNILSS